MSRTATLRWDGGRSFSAESALGGSVALEGADGWRGTRPSEMLLVALAACAGMDVIAILEKKREVVERYALRVSGEQRAAHPQTFTSIELLHEFDGDALEPDAVRRAIELSATRYCIVSAHVSQGEARVVHRYVVRNASGEHAAEVVVTGPRGAGLDPRPD